MKRSRTTSQKIAFIYLVIGTTFFIPGFLMTLFSVGFPVLLIFTLPVFIIGSLLLYGYYSHYYKELSRKDSLILWSITFLYNGLFVLISASLSYSNFQNESIKLLDVVYSAGIICFYVFLCFMAGFGFYLDKKEL